MLAFERIYHCGYTVGMAELPSQTDPSPSRQSRPGSVFVGRRREMESLVTALDDTLSGQGRLVMLVGEPGIGKTRTAQELASYAESRGAQVLRRSWDAALLALGAADPVLHRTL